jgi:hypothetical protein
MQSAARSNRTSAPHIVAYIVVFYYIYYPIIIIYDISDISIYHTRRTNEARTNHTKRSRSEDILIKYYIPRPRPS